MTDSSEQFAQLAVLFDKTMLNVFYVGLGIGILVGASFIYMVL